MVLNIVKNAVFILFLYKAYCFSPDKFLILPKISFLKDLYDWIYNFNNTKISA